MPGDPRLRASDADRERTAQLLREHHAVGRLTAEEFEGRLEQVFQARTLGELDALLADLPEEDRSGSARHGRWGAPLLLPLLPLLIVALALSHGRALWLAFPLAFFFVVRPLRRCGIRSTT